MNPQYDLEVIRSAILSGEIDDAAKLIQKNMKKYERAYNITKKEIFREHMSILNDMMLVLEGKKGTDELRDKMLKMRIYGEDDYEAFVNSFIYILDYCLDRYNVRWPSFDGKRCDDL